MPDLDSLRSAAARRIDDAAAHWAAIHGALPPDDLDARRLRALAAVLQAADADAIEAAIEADGLGVL